MNPKIHLKKDNLDEVARNFEMKPLRQPTFLNSVPKSGTHLIRNIARMFVPVEQHYRTTFVQLAILHQHLAAYSPEHPKLSWGHLIFSDTSAVALRNVRHILLVRDPYSWVLARTRFFLSDQFQGNLNNIKNGAASIEDVMNIMIFGAIDKAPALIDIYSLNAVAWMGTQAKIVRYEDIVAHLKDLDSPASEQFFKTLIIDKMGIEEWPSDWKQRILVGSDRQHSGTAREHLRHGIEVPEELPDTQKALVEFHAPGLRKLLGYS